MRYFLLFLAITIIGCGGKIEGEFTSDELAWLVYDKGDTVLYKNNQAENRSLVVDHRTDLSQIRNHYPIEAEIEIFSPENDEKFRIYLLKDEETFKKYLRMGEVYRSFDLVEPKESMVINDKTYKDVFVFSEDTTESETTVWKVFYNKQYGIIKYMKRDNQAYELADLSESG